ncbi:MAG: hypothetical protein ABUL60_08000 [Myxococcales bacterium]
MSNLDHQNGDGAITDRPIHILPAAATMVGVCMTVISVVRIVQKGGVLVAHVVAFASLAFLSSSISAYFAIRRRNAIAKFEIFAEWCFLAGLVLLTFAVIVIAFEIRAR